MDERERERKREREKKVLKRYREQSIDIERRFMLSFLLTRSKR